MYRASNDVTPQFALDALSPGRYTFLVYSETPRGRSQHPAALHSIPIRTSDDLDVPGNYLKLVSNRIHKILWFLNFHYNFLGSLQTMTPAPPMVPQTDNSIALLVGAVMSLILVTILTTLCVTLVIVCKKKQRPQRDPEQK